MPSSRENDAGGPPAWDVNAGPDGSGAEPREQAHGARTELSGRPAVIGTLIDMTDRRRTEHALRESEERYALAARGANDGLWDWDLVANRVYLSPRWKAISTR